MLNTDVNYLAVLVAAVINMVIGAFWYSPAGFGKQWSKLIGKKMEDMKANGAKGYGVTTAFAIVQSFGFAVLIRSIDITTISNGVLLGLILWVCFVAACTVSDYVFGGRPIKLWQINSGYYLLVLLINGALLASWR